MNIKVKFTENTETLRANLGEVQTVTEYIGGEVYAGDYAVTPKAEAQTMPTKGKVMTDDVVIHKIPYYEVSNNSGGTTVYIGNEV